MTTDAAAAADDDDDDIDWSACQFCSCFCTYTCSFVEDI